MRKLHLFLIAVPAFALGVALTATLTTPAQAKPPVPTSPIIYMHIITNSLGSLDTNSRTGWEVVACVYDSHQKKLVWTMRKAK